MAKKKKAVVKAVVKEADNGVRKMTFKRGGEPAKAAKKAKGTTVNFS